MNDTILITGASSGLGQAVANLLTEYGYKVYGTSRNPEAYPHSTFNMLRLDVRNDESVRECIETILSRDGKIDVVINNAAVIELGPTEETPLDRAQELFNTNFFGMVRVIKAVLPTMRRQRSGRIVNISSMAGLIGSPGMAFYSASKHAIEGYTESLRFELEPLGIHVCLVEPGFFNSNLHRSDTDPADLIADYDGFRENIKQAVEKNIRRGRSSEIIAQYVLPAVTDTNPKLRYKVNFKGKMLLWIKAALPDKWIAMGTRRKFKI